MSNDSVDRFISFEDSMSPEEFARYKRNKFLKTFIPVAILVIAGIIFVMIRANGPDLTEQTTCTECGIEAKCTEIKEQTGRYKYYCEDCWNDVFNP